MRIEQVDERDSGWESHDARFRVYVFDEFSRSTEADGSSTQYYSTATWDITGGDVLAVIEWAQERAGDRGLYSVAVVADGFEAHPDRGLIWLVGMDYQDTPVEERFREVQQRMLGRRGRMVIRGE